MNSPHAFTTIIFDLDGTLIDTFPSLLGAVRECAPATALSAIDPHTLRRALSSGLDHFFEQAVAQMGSHVEDPIAMRAHVAATYHAAWLCRAAPYPQAQRLLDAVSLAGHAMGICTNRDKATTLALLTHLGWTPLFGSVICRGDAPHPKPHPLPLLTTLAQLGRRPDEAIFVGDSAVDAQCAARAAVGFLAHSLGYHDQRAELEPNLSTFSNHLDVMAHFHAGSDQREAHHG